MEYKNEVSELLLDEPASKPTQSIGKADKAERVPESHTISEEISAQQSAARCQPNFDRADDMLGKPLELISRPKLDLKEHSKSLVEHTSPSRPS